MAECNVCNGNPNLGLGDCIKTVGKPVGLFFTPTVANDGTENVIPLGGTSLIDIDTFANHVDPSKRWYPLQDLKDFTIEASAADYKTFGDKSKVLIGKSGNRIYSAKASIVDKKALPGLQKNLTKFDCREMSVFLLTVNDAVLGEHIDTNLVPMQINSFDPVGMFANDTMGTEITISFDFYSEFEFGRLRQIFGISFTYLPSKAKGLRNANIDYTVAAQTSSTVVLTTDYANGMLSQDVHGLVAADFAITNKTTGLPVSILTVTETPNVNYIITYASQTVGNTLEIKVLVNTKKYEGEATKTVA